LVINEISADELQHSPRALRHFNFLSSHRRIHHDKLFKTTVGVWPARFFQLSACAEIQSSV